MIKSPKLKPFIEKYTHAVKSTMNSKSYPMFAKALEAFLNPLTDKKCKTWDEVTDIFIAMNKEQSIRDHTLLALLFKNARHPNYFRIHGFIAVRFLDNITMTDISLSKYFDKGIDFIGDHSGVRLSFETFRHLILSKGSPSTIEAFNTIDKLYQIYLGYVIAMASRARYNTHWMIVERISGFTKNMQPHIIHPPTKKDDKKEKTQRKQASTEKDSKKHTIMTSQPSVYCIMRGTLRSLTARLEKYKSEHAAYKNAMKSKIKGEVIDPPKYDYKPISQIYESVLIDADDEIDYIIDDINFKYAMPYRKEQVAESYATCLVETKHCIKLTQSLIMIDSQATTFDVDDLVREIEDVRFNLIYGEQSHPRKPKPLASYRKQKRDDGVTLHNQTSLKNCNDTNLQFIDDFNMISLNPKDDSINVIPTSATRVTRALSFNSDDPESVIDSNVEDEDEDDSESDEAEDEASDMDIDLQSDHNNEDEDEVEYVETKPATSNKIKRERKEITATPNHTQQLRTPIVEPPRKRDDHKPTPVAMKQKEPEPPRRRSTRIAESKLKNAKPIRK